jgi:hypothetical protein
MLRGHLLFFLLRQALVRDRFSVYRLDVRALPQVLAHPLLGRAQERAFLDLFTNHDTELDTRPLSVKLLRLLNRVKSGNYLEVLGNRLSLIDMTGGLHFDAISSHYPLPCPSLDKRLLISSGVSRLLKPVISSFSMLCGRAHLVY